MYFGRRTFFVPSDNVEIVGVGPCSYLLHHAVGDPFLCIDSTATHLNHAEVFLSISHRPQACNCRHNSPVQTLCGSIHLHTSSTIVVTFVVRHLFRRTESCALRPSCRLVLFGISYTLPVLRKFRKVYHVAFQKSAFNKSHWCRITSEVRTALILVLHIVINKNLQISVDL